MIGDVIMSDIIYASKTRRNPYDLNDVAEMRHEIRMRKGECKRRPLGNLYDLNEVYRLRKHYARRL